MYSGLTPTVVLRYINRMLGSVVQEIELSEEEIMRVVFQESLYTYSKFFPYKYKLPVNYDDSISPDYPNVYRIPNDDRLEIIGIHRVWLSQMNQFGGSLLPAVNDPFQSQFLNDYLSAVITPTTFEFQAPNLITIRPKIARSQGALIEVKAVHPRHMKTIPITMRDEFLRLCLDDVLLSLYPIRKRYSSLNTPYGSIEVFTEMVDKAEDDKRELLDKWRDNFLKAATAKRIWIS